MRTERKGDMKVKKQLNTVNLGRMQRKPNDGSRNSVEITNICICARICNFNYE